MTPTAPSQVTKDLSSFVLVPKDIWETIIHDEISDEERSILKTRMKNMDQVKPWKSLKKPFLNS